MTSKEKNQIAQDADETDDAIVIADFLGMGVPATLVVNGPDADDEEYHCG